LLGRLSNFYQGWGPGKGTAIDFVLFRQRCDRDSMKIDLVPAMQVGILATYFFQIEVCWHSRIVVDISGCARNPVIVDERKTSDTVDCERYF
jgi:hypothetical protein